MDADDDRSITPSEFAAFLHSYKREHPSEGGERMRHEGRPSAKSEAQSTVQTDPSDTGGRTKSMTSLRDSDHNAGTMAWKRAQTMAGGVSAFDASRQPSTGSARPEPEPSMTLLLEAPVGLNIREKIAWQKAQTMVGAVRAFDASRQPSTGSARPEPEPSTSTSMMLTTVDELGCLSDVESSPGTSSPLKFGPPTPGPPPSDNAAAAPVLVQDDEVPLGKDGRPLSGVRLKVSCSTR